ncbi:MAG: DUF2239 family protein, partial [Armatimonadota bacterium]|nr:DUF2239 family protein [Armatimonadota bacterium]
MILTTHPHFPLGLRTPCTAFQGDHKVASGALAQVVRTAKELVDADHNPVLVFDAAASRLIEIDYRGPADAVVERLAYTVGEGTPVTETAPPRPGRPKLGVVAREVTLLPRHWEWLNAQPGGASVALRKLVEDARKANSGKDRVREAQESCYRFLSVMAGDRPGYEEALRALYAGNREGFAAHTDAWPPDIRAHARQLA